MSTQARPPSPTVPSGPSGRRPLIVFAIAIPAAGTVGALAAFIDVIRGALPVVVVAGAVVVVVLSRVRAGRRR